MMYDFIYALNAVSPMIILIVLGNILANTGVMKTEFIKQGSRVCYNLFLPLQFFVTLYKNENNFSEIGPVAIYVFSSILISYAVAMLIILKMEETPQKVAGLACSIFKCNYALIGIPLAASLLGADNISGISLIVGVFIALNNTVSVLMLTLVLGDKGRGGFWAKVWKIVKGVITNPLFLASVFGLIVSKLHIVWPSFIDKPLNQLANVATPLSLLIIGADFRFGSFGNYKKEMLFLVLFKGIAAPVLTLGIARRLGFDTFGMVAVLVSYTAPVSPSAYVMADANGADSTLTSASIMVTSLISAFTIFFGVLYLRVMGYL